MRMLEIIKSHNIQLTVFLYKHNYIKIITSVFSIEVFLKKIKKKKKKKLRPVLYFNIASLVLLK